MREKTLYARLAWTGMRKNRRLYLPYLLSCAGMVLMFYILMGLSGSPVLGHMSGGTSSATALMPCSCRRLFSRISVWMTANSAAAASRDDADTVSV